ncbi:sensor histidine kinase [Candidatus Aerophobetes bacterium]|uniref:histidine kinase n=1 Tax=Aerophobetes bacterium TaxID=2030807 RepID=A0A523RR79_UNCAE|nr:MAG: sensor histidine kinase [Candidatus Aerophobetes bacterium]
MLLALITYIPAASDYTVNYGIELYPVGFIFILVFASITTHAIVTYRLMDIAVVMTRGGVLAGTYAFIIGVPALVASVARPWLVGAMGRFWWVPPLGLFAGLALVGPFVALFLIHKIEGKQRERALRAEEHLERTAQGMIEIDSVGRLAKIIPRYLTQFYYSALDISITHATIFLLDKDRGEYVLKSTSGIRRISLDKTLPEKENPIYIWFKKIVPLIIEKRFVRRRELDVLQREDIDFWLKEERLLRLDDYIKPALIELKKLMVELRAVLCVPSYYQEGLLGFLILGEKEKGLFRPQELSLFFRLSRYAGLAIRSAQLSQDLQQAYASVAQADRLSSMGQLAASFAHEINNPVAIIISGIELSLVNMREDLLKASSVEEKEKVINYTEDKLGKIKDEAFRISHIIGRIMGYVKAPMGDFTSVRLEDLIEATLGLVEHPLRKKQINVVKEIPKDLPRIRGIAGELQEVFLNLFNNALEAIEDETLGSINILARTLANPEMVEIKVSDTGGGISPENLRKIFDFLFTTKLQGTGVGLSVVYNIIKKHDGTIDVESEMGKGTTFTIRLPIWKEEEAIKR